MSAVEKLTSLVSSKERYDIPYSDLLPAQVEAANERFQDRIGKIQLVRHRAQEADVTAIRSAADLAPLLFAHTTYKSYPESWLAEGKWDRLGKWLNTVSTYRVEGVDTEGVKDIDDWLSRLAAAGHYVSCSSGTTGKCSMINSSNVDREFGKQSTANGFMWATGNRPTRDFYTISTTAVASSPRNNDNTEAIMSNFGSGEGYKFPGPRPTIGQVSKMVQLRRAIADGTAKPADLAAFEATSAQRQQTLDEGVAGAVEAMIANRDKKLLISGMFANLFRIAEMVRARGYGGKDFRPDNALFVGGGLKGAVLPPDYREQVVATFNLQPQNIYQFYSMQEINSPMPRCLAGRYHVNPWVLLLLLDEGGDALIPPAAGEMEGRAGYFDLALDGRWGGVISGDKVKVNYGPCACGHQGPTVASDITRYADLAGGDKITCAGTIDAYIRGVA